MNEALRVPHFNIGDEYDLTRLAAVRAALNKELAASAGVKLSLTSFLVKAVSVALSDFPTLNSKFDCLTQDAVSRASGQQQSQSQTASPLLRRCVKCAGVRACGLRLSCQYTIFDSHNISLAIDTPHGLVVPNIKNVQSKSLIEIQKDILLLQEKASQTRGLRWKLEEARTRLFREQSAGVCWGVLGAGGQTLHHGSDRRHDRHIECGSHFR